MSTGKQKDFDIIVVGGGHNGLTAAAYLVPLAGTLCGESRRENQNGALAAGPYFLSFTETSDTSATGKTGIVAFTGKT